MQRSLHNRSVEGSRKGLLLASLFLISAALAGNYYRKGIPRYSRPTLPGHSVKHTSVVPARGPLRVDSANPRYFTDGGGKAVLLTGAHTWSNVQDNGYGDPPPAFDYDAYLDFLVANNLNFTRLWCWEQSRWAPWVTADDYYFYPGPPFQRTGPGNALDGKPRFDLDRLNPLYFERLRSRVARAAEKGIYVSIMLFNAWGTDDKHAPGRGKNPWRGHPFNRNNNVNGVDGDPNHNENGEATHQLLVTRVTSYQEAYVRQVIETVNEFDNVLFEISNESFATSRDWQYHIINLIHRLEATKPKQHPVGMSQYQWPGNNGDLWEGPADWIAPWEELPDYPYRDNPRVADGKKVVIVDTDHVWGIGGDRKWVWKVFLRGNQPSFMDAYDGASVGCGAPAPWDVRRAGWKDIVKDVLGQSVRPDGWNPDAEQWVGLRANMGYIREFSRRIKLAEMKPRPGLSSSGYCLAYANRLSAEYLVYAEDSSKPITINLSEYTGELSQEWFEPSTGRTVIGDRMSGGASRRLESPFKGDTVLYVRSIETH